VLGKTFGHGRVLVDHYKDASQDQSANLVHVVGPRRLLQSEFCRLIKPVVCNTQERLVLVATVLYHPALSRLTSTPWREHHVRFWTCRIAEPHAIAERAGPSPPLTVTADAKAA
jgi:hypothetical protein